jgi:uncharacterized phage protein gp47/JayE
MSKTVPSFEKIRDRYLQAVVNLEPTAAIGPDSDHFVRATAVAAVVEGIYSRVMWVFRQAFPDLADEDLMEKAANQKGVFRKAAAVAAGAVRFSGAAGASIPAGQQLSNAQGVVFSTLAAAVVGVGGTVDVTAVAVAAGTSGNQSNNTPATVIAAPDGITAAATILTMTGGAEIESSASLLDRLLLELSEVAQGGNDKDYERWARSVPGVEKAYRFPVRRGNGTVDVVPMPSSGLPSVPLLAAVQAVLDAKRPVGMVPGWGVLALAPTAVLVDVTAALSLASGYTLDMVAPQVQAAILAVFARLEPGNTLVRHQLITAILNVPGVTDVTLSTPAANVTCSVDETTLELIMPGAIAIS